MYRFGQVLCVEGFYRMRQGHPLGEFDELSLYVLLLL